MHFCINHINTIDYRGFVCQEKKCGPNSGGTGEDYVLREGKEGYAKFSFALEYR
jgi:hypothetical protein